jgi:hypothetical protein
MQIRFSNGRFYYKSNLVCIREGGPKYIRNIKIIILNTFRVWTFFFLFGARTDCEVQNVYFVQIIT